MPAKCKQHCKNQSCTPQSHCWLNNLSWPQFLKRSFYTLWTDTHDTGSQRLPTQTLMHHGIVIIFIYLQNAKLDTILNKMDMVLPQGVTMLSGLPTPVSQNNLSLYSSLDLSASTPEGDTFMQKYLCQYETVLSYNCLSLSCCWCRLIEHFSLSSVQKPSVKLTLGYWPGAGSEGKWPAWDCVGCLARVVSTKKMWKKCWHYPGRRCALPFNK